MSVYRSANLGRLHPSPVPEAAPVSFLYLENRGKYGSHWFQVLGEFGALAVAAVLVLRIKHLRMRGVL